MQAFAVEFVLRLWLGWLAVWPFVLAAMAVAAALLTAGLRVR